MLDVDGVRRKLEQPVNGTVAIGGLFGNHRREIGGGDVGRLGQVWGWILGRWLLCRGGTGKKRERAQSQHSHVNLLLTLDSISISDSPSCQVSHNRDRKRGGTRRGPKGLNVHARVSRRCTASANRMMSE